MPLRRVMSGLIATWFVMALAIAPARAGGATYWVTVHLQTCRDDVEQPVVEITPWSDTNTGGKTCAYEWESPATVLLDGVAPDRTDNLVYAQWQHVSPGDHQITIAGAGPAAVSFTVTDGDVGFSATLYAPQTPPSSGAHTVTVDLGWCHLPGGGVPTTTVGSALNPSGLGESCVTGYPAAGRLVLDDGITPDGGDGVTSVSWSNVPDGVHLIRDLGSADTSHAVVTVSRGDVELWATYYDTHGIPPGPQVRPGATPVLTNNGNSGVDGPSTPGGQDESSPVPMVTQLPNTGAGNADGSDPLPLLAIDVSLVAIIASGSLFMRRRGHG